jgi:hypothetical protein
MPHETDTPADRLRKDDEGPFQFRIRVGDCWRYIGTTYRDKSVAKSWRSFVRTAWHQQVYLCSYQQVMRERAALDAAKGQQ